MQDEFLAMLSHELRTPMSAMLGWLHLMKTGRLSAEQDATAVDTMERDAAGETHPAPAIDTIERNARVQTQLVNDLLDVSRIVTGKMELQTEVMQLGRALENS